MEWNSVNIISHWNDDWWPSRSWRRFLIFNFLLISVFNKWTKGLGVSASMIVFVHPSEALWNASLCSTPIMQYQHIDSGCPEYCMFLLLNSSYCTVSVFLLGPRLSHNLWSWILWDGEINFFYRGALELKLWEVDLLSGSWLALLVSFPVIPAFISNEWTHSDNVKMYLKTISRT